MISYLYVFVVSTYYALIFLLTPFLDYGVFRQQLLFFVSKTAHLLVRDVRKFVTINRKTGEKGADIHFIETEFQENEKIFFM